MVLVDVSEPAEAARMDEPGAHTSTQSPWLEKPEARSDVVVDPTVTVSGAEAGDWVHASLASFPYRRSESNAVRSGRV